MERCRAIYRCADKSIELPQSMQLEIIRIASLSPYTSRFLSERACIMQSEKV